MNRNTKGVIYCILVIVSTAAIFFCIGYFCSAIYGRVHTFTTVIEYVEPTGPLDPDEIPGVSGFEKIDLNSATLEQLMTVPGIGETYAKRIITYRDDVGGFNQLEQLQEVDGVGEKRYLQWLPYFTLSEKDRLEE